MAITTFTDTPVVPPPADHGSGGGGMRLTVNLTFRALDKLQRSCGRQRTTDVDGMFEELLLRGFELIAHHVSGELRFAWGPFRRRPLWRPHCVAHDAVRAEVHGSNYDAALYGLVSERKHYMSSKDLVVTCRFSVDRLNMNQLDALARRYGYGRNILCDEALRLGASAVRWRALRKISRWQHERV